MTTTESSASTAPPSTYRTTHHHRCDEDFLALLEEDFGLDLYSLKKAFMGVPPAPKKQAICLCEWAIKAAKGDLDEAGKALRAWARKQGKGAYDRRLIERLPVGGAS